MEISNESREQFWKSCIEMDRSRFIARLFYQDGFPLAMSFDYCDQHGITYNIRVVINELRRNGWSDKTIYNKLHGELSKDIEWKQYLFL